MKNIQKKITKENKNIKKIAQNYISYINKINQENESSSKNFYLIIKKEKLNIKLENYEEIIFQELNENYIKIKESLNRCGNIVININSKKEVEDILESFINKRKYLNKI